MEYAVLGWPPGGPDPGDPGTSRASETSDGGPKLRLDHERFSYAGKFVMTDTGKAVARAGDGIAAAAAFSPDRTDPGTLRLRYVTVRADRRGEGIGPRLARFVVERARDRGYERARIAVNNPFAYQALYRAGFGYTGERTGLAELVLERPDPTERSPEAYRAGLDVYRGRDLSADERAFLESKREADPPPVVDPPG